MLMSEIVKKSFENPYEFSTLRKKTVKNFGIYFKKGSAESQGSVGYYKNVTFSVRNQKWSMIRKSSRLEIFENVRLKARKNWVRSTF